MNDSITDNNGIQMKLLLIVICFAMIACAGNKKGEDALFQTAMELSGNNRQELEKVLKYYENDSLKLEAAKFLISNMIGKKSISYTFYYNDETCLLDTLHFKDYHSLQEWIRQGSFAQDPVCFDLKNISSDYLIQNIELAFEVREKYDWCKSLSFEEFCCSVLPYRIQNEPLENWRSFYYYKYVHLVDSLSSKGYKMKDIVFFLNEALQKKYIHELSEIPGDFSVKLIEHFQGGTCEHLALNSIQLMRSFGIPLQMDRIPYHGRVNGGHAYNSFTDEKGDFYYFSPYEREQERNRWIAPLVMRVNYKFDLSKDRSAKDELNSILTNPLLKNVTSWYYKTTDVLLPVSNDHVYLATFNRGNFHVVAEAESIDNMSHFANIACGLLYFPMTIKNGHLFPVYKPFIVSEEGETVIIPCEERETEINGISLYDAKRILALDKTPHQLYYWNNGWQRCGQTVSSDSLHLDFGRIAYNSLFLIYGDYYLGKMQRPLIIKEKTAVFY